MLFLVQVHHEIDQCAFQACAKAAVKDETAASHFGGAFEIDDVQIGAEVPMWFYFKSEFRLVAPCPDFYVVIFRIADRYAVMRNVRHAHHDKIQALFHIAQFVIDRFDFFADLAHLRNRFIRIFLVARHQSNVLGCFVAFRLQFLCLGNQFPALQVQTFKIIQYGNILTAFCKFRFHFFKIGSYKSNVQHKLFLL